MCKKQPPTVTWKNETEAKPGSRWENTEKDRENFWETRTPRESRPYTKMALYNTLVTLGFGMFTNDLGFFFLQY